MNLDSSPGILRWLRYIPVLLLAVTLLFPQVVGPEINNSMIPVPQKSVYNLALPDHSIKGDKIQRVLGGDFEYSGSVVNPYLHYKNEPAPMGITDFGIGPNGIPYCYNSTSFRGTISLNNMNITNLGPRGNSSCFGFQLNAVLYFKSGGNAFSFWVQNAVKINTISHAITFIDNIWNFTGCVASMPGQTVLGNGGVVNAFFGSFYFFEDPLPVNVQTPLNLTLQTNVTTYENGVPELDLMYNLGSGFVTYDQPMFVFTTNAINPVFRVDGCQYAISNKTFYDASLIMGGPCAGDHIYVNSANVTMQLQYWNGWNYQYISNAYNFGANTAEASCNVIASQSVHLKSNFIGSQLVQGNGSIGQIYNAANLSFFHLKVPFKQGSMELGKEGYNFTMGQLNLTLPYHDGLQHLCIKNQKRVVYSTNISLEKGQYKYLMLTNLSFREDFFPLKEYKNFTWYLDLNGTEYNTNGTSLNFCLPAGNYTYSASYNNDVIPFYNENGTLALNGTNRTVDLHFFEEAFGLLLHPVGLQSGTPWIVSVEGVSVYYGSFPDPIEIYLPNGTFTFKVWNIQGYHTISNSSVTIKVNGECHYFNIEFAKNKISNNYPLNYWYIFALAIVVSISTVAYWYFRRKND